MVIGTSKFDSHLRSTNVGIVYLLFKFYHTLTFAPAPEVKSDCSLYWCDSFVCYGTDLLPIS